MQRTFYRLGSLLLVLVMLIGTNWQVNAAVSVAPSQDSVLTFNPVADAYVIQSSASSNYGSDTNLRVDGSPTTRSYLRFDVSGLNGDVVQSVVLRIYANTSNDIGFDVRTLTDNGWDENGITYASAPAPGAVINSSQAFSGGNWVEVDLTGYVSADGTYSLVLDTTSPTNTRLASRESGSHAPQLIVTTASQATETPLPQPTSTNVPTATSQPPATATPGQVSQVTFTPVADAYVIQTSPSVNFGSDLNLRVDASPTTRSYLRFDVSGLNGSPVQSALLRIYANTTNDIGFDVRSLTDNSWSENGITYNNAPAPGGVINSSKGFSGGNWIEIDISSYISGDGSYSLMLDTTSPTNTRLASREDTSHAPQLVVTAGGQVGPTATPQPTATLAPSHTPTAQAAATNTPLPTATSQPQPTATSGQPSTVTFTPVADAYVIQSSSGSNYGTDTALRVDGTPPTRSYLRFTVSGLNGAPVQSAVLRIYANSSNNIGFDVHALSNDSWSETGITYANAPAEGSVIASSTGFIGGNWVQVDISSYITADGNYDLVLDTTSPTNTNLASREDASHRPQLVITAGGQVGPTATPQPTSTSAPNPTNTPVPTATNQPQPTATSGQPSVVTFAPVADSYVIQSSSSSNYGTDTAIRVDDTPITRSYLRFNVSGLNGANVQSVVLRIYADTSNNIGFDVHALSDNSWTESGITYANAPAPEFVIGSAPGFSGGNWVNVDITGYVVADGAYDMVLDTTSPTNTKLASREDTSHAPQLVVTAGGQIGPTATPQPTATIAPTRTPSGATATSTSVSNCTAVILPKGPTLIFTGDNTKMRVFWQWSSNATFQVQWGMDTSYGLGNVAVTPSDTSNHLYTYDISGLTPGSKYYYRVVVGSQCSGGSFYAAPPSSATSIKFFSYGDTRTNGSEHNKLAGLVNSVYQSDPAFQTLNLDVGDWVSSDSESAWTSEWFNPSYTALRAQDANISDIGNRGNHEGAATYWKRYWPEPFQPGGLYWSFDYGPMHVVVLDQYTSYTPGSAQYNWLQADLAATTKPWKFIMLHEPGWSAGGGHANNTTVQNDIQPLCLQYGVQIVFGGHNHYYARASVNGVVHLTLGGGGAPQYTPASGQPNIVAYSKSYSFGEFTINGNTLTAKIVNDSGATIDSFTITR